MISKAFFLQIHDGKERRTENSIKEKKREREVFFK
jgi:hypothetical protein